MLVILGIGLALLAAALRMALSTDDDTEFVRVINGTASAAYNNNNNNNNATAAPTNPGLLHMKVKVDGANDFEFLLAYMVEMALSYFLYYPVIGTILFSGILSCGHGSLLGGRPYEIRKHHHDQDQQHRPTKIGSSEHKKYNQHEASSKMTVDVEQGRSKPMTRSSIKPVARTEANISPNEQNVTSQRERNVVNSKHVEQGVSKSMAKPPTKVPGKADNRRQSEKQSTNQSEEISMANSKAPLRTISNKNKSQLPPDQMKRSKVQNEVVQFDSHYNLNSSTTNKKPIKSTTHVPHKVILPTELPYQPHENTKKENVKRDNKRKSAKKRDYSSARLEDDPVVILPTDIDPEPIKENRADNEINNSSSQHINSTEEYPGLSTILPTDIDEEH